MDWFLYDNGLRYERIKVKNAEMYAITLYLLNIMQ